MCIRFHHGAPERLYCLTNLLYSCCGVAVVQRSKNHEDVESSKHWYIMLLLRIFTFSDRYKSLVCIVCFFLATLGYYVLLYLLLNIIFK